MAKKCWLVNLLIWCGKTDSERWFKSDYPGTTHNKVISLKIQPMIFHTKTAQRLKFSIQDFFSKCDQLCRFLRIGNIYWRNPKRKTSFFVQCKLKRHWWFKICRQIFNKVLYAVSEIFKLKFCWLSSVCDNFVSL